MGLIKHVQCGLHFWSLIFLNASGWEKRNKKTKRTLPIQNTNYMKGWRQNYTFLPGLNERAVSLSVYHDCYSEEMWHDYRFEALDKYIAIMSGTAYLFFNGCVPMWMHNRFMPTMRPSAISINHDGFIILILIK